MLRLHVTFSSTTNLNIILKYVIYIITLNIKPDSISTGANIEWPIYKQFKYMDEFPFSRVNNRRARIHQTMLISEYRDQRRLHVHKSQLTVTFKRPREVFRWLHSERLRHVSENALLIIKALRGQRRKVCERHRWIRVERKARDERGVSRNRRGWATPLPTSERMPWEWRRHQVPRTTPRAHRVV